MNRSRRTFVKLWRKFKKEGTGFLDIRDPIKRDWALLLLEEPRYTVEQAQFAVRLNVEDGDSPKSWRYSTENRPNSVNPAASAARLT